MAQKRDKNEKDEQRRRLIEANYFGFMEKLFNQLDSLLSSALFDSFTNPPIFPHTPSRLVNIVPKTSPLPPHSQHPKKRQIEFR